uniref:Uncharacterized protein n=1 Tax=Panagrolaimus sp. ES5 TaxID=591445 RepID=A0AC34G1R7_9BILA
MDFLHIHLKLMDFLHLSIRSLICEKIEYEILSFLKDVDVVVLKVEEETGVETLDEPVDANVVVSITEVFVFDEVWENIVDESVDSDEDGDNLVVDDDVDDSLHVDIPVVIYSVDSVVGI